MSERNEKSMNDDEYRVVKIGFFKKVWLSITKFERYPEMATEGVGRAISYLMKLMLIFSAILVIGMIYNFNKSINQGIQYINENFSEINYQDGTLQIKPTNSETLDIDTEIGKLIIDTNVTEQDKIKEYEDKIKSGNMGILWLNNKVVVYSNGIEEGYYYKDILNQMGISSLTKSDLTNYINNKTIYIVYGIFMLISTFILYLIATLIDALILSLFGLITTYIIRIKMRYRAIFNMSIYALTISILLKLLYVTLNMFIDFDIKYFDFMYSAIGYICLVASIFMIKSDVIKQQMELMKIIEEKKQQEEQGEQEEKEEPEDDKEEKKQKENKKDDENKEKKENKETPDINNQGSEA